MSNLVKSFSSIPLESSVNQQIELLKKITRLQEKQIIEFNNNSREKFMNLEARIKMLESNQGGQIDVSS